MSLPLAGWCYARNHVITIMAIGTKERNRLCVYHNLLRIEYTKRTHCRNKQWSSISWLNICVAWKHNWEDWLFFVRLSKQTDCQMCMKIVFSYNLTSMWWCGIWLIDFKRNLKKNIVCEVHGIRYLISTIYLWRVTADLWVVLRPVVAQILFILNAVETSSN